MSKKKPGAFTLWLEKQNSHKLAKTLKIDPATVRSWRIGRSTPRPAQMQKIKNLTRGKISYQMMIENN